MNDMNIFKESELSCWSKIQYKFNLKKTILKYVTSMTLFTNYQEGHTFPPQVFHTGHIHYFLAKGISHYRSFSNKI